MNTTSYITKIDTKKGWEFLLQISHAYCTFLSMLEMFIQLPAAMTKLRHIKCDIIKILLLLLLLRYYYYYYYYYKCKD